MKKNKLKVKRNPIVKEKKKSISKLQHKNQKVKDAKELVCSENLQKKDKKDKTPKKPKLNSIKKCKRGFKFCKNDKCTAMMPIHQQKCPDCNFDQKINKSCNSKKKEKAQNLHKEIEKIQEKFQGSAKNDQQAFSLKKKLLFKNEFNTISNQPKHKNLDDNFSKRILCPPKKSKIVEIQDCFIPKTEPIKIFNHDSNTFSSLKQFENIYDPKYQNIILNLGLPISCLSWAPRCDSSQFLAIGVSTQKNYFINDVSNNITIFSMNLEFLNLINDEGCSKSGYVVICRVDNDNFKDFKLEISYILEIKHRNIDGLLWCPCFSQNSQEIGLLAVNTIQDIQIFSMPLLKNQEIPSSKTIELEPQIIIQIGKTKFTAFDWSDSEKNDLMLVGDREGNVLLIRLIETNNFEILNSYIFAHNSEITDLKFFPLNDEKTIIFATAGFDGYLKIFENMNQEIPLFESQLSKTKIFNLFWDQGGRFIIANREGSSPSALLTSFFSVQKISNMNIHLSEKIKLMHIDSFPPPEFKIDSFMQVKSSIFSDWVYLSDAEGHVLYTDSEYLRKASSKKRKKKKVSINAILDDETNYNLKLLLKLDYDAENKGFEILNNKQVKKKSNTNAILNVQKTLKSLAVCPNLNFFDLVAVGSLGGLIILKINNKK